MARPTKDGLDYFSFDVDFFDNKKVRKIMRGCGPQSALILTCLLCNIYHKKGYYTLVDDDLPFDIADKLGVSEGTVKETIVKAVQVSFFDPNQYELNKILTSKEILNRYKAGVTKRENVVIDERFTVYSSINPVSSSGNSINDTGNTQSKVKETKVNQSKGTKVLVVADATTGKPSRKDYEKLVEEYTDKDMNTVVSVLKEFLAKRPEFVEPYRDYWNIAVQNTTIPKCSVINDSRQKKLKTRIMEPAFDFVEVIRKVRESNKLKHDSNWFSFDWVFDNDKNYLKILEGNYAG